MLNHLVHMYAWQFVLYTIAVMVAPYMFAALLQHYGKVNDAHAHVNHVLAGMIVITLAGLALWGSGVGTAFARSFDDVRLVSPAVTYRAVAKPTARPAFSQLAIRRHRHWRH